MQILWKTKRLCQSMIKCHTVRSPLKIICCTGFPSGCLSKVYWMQIHRFFFWFCFSPVSLRWFSAGLSSWVGLHSGGTVLHVALQDAAGDPCCVGVRRRAVRLRRVWHDPLLSSLWLAKERLISVQSESLPCQTSLWAPEIRWANRFKCCINWNNQIVATTSPVISLDLDVVLEPFFFLSLL